MNQEDTNFRSHLVIDTTNVRKQDKIIFKIYIYSVAIVQTSFPDDWSVN